MFTNYLVCDLEGNLVDGILFIDFKIADFNFNKFNNQVVNLS